ncbi:MAG: trehalose-6-phosphate synthase, partial [Acidimicrobiales bacterium]
VNERFGTGSWRPVVMEVEDDFASTVAAFRRYDVLLVNPVRDGMNLVAKEGPSLNERGGVLVLSELAGAYEELQDDVLGVNPFDVRATSQALLSALEMPEAERRRRAAALAAKAALRGPAGWLEVVLDKAVCPRAVPG